MTNCELFCPHSSQSASIDDIVVRYRYRPYLRKIERMIRGSTVALLLSFSRCRAPRRTMRTFARRQFSTARGRGAGNAGSVIRRAARSRLLHSSHFLSGIHARHATRVESLAPPPQTRVSTIMLSMSPFLVADSRCRRPHLAGSELRRPMPRHRGQ